MGRLLVGFVAHVPASVGGVGWHRSSSFPLPAAVQTLRLIRKTTSCSSRLARRQDLGDLRAPAASPRRQRAELGAIDSGRRFDHPPQTSLPPNPDGQSVEVLAGRFRIRLPLRTDRNPLAPTADAGRYTDAIAILPIALRQTPVPGEPRRLAPAGEGPSLLIGDVEPDPVRGHSPLRPGAAAPNPRCQRRPP